ncbi:hypothetical protein LOTGIDRAFT_171148 [Lottia gigantea]|uniref:Uncharacterized protein n=1 Tax=Lottia gigantea TaxID=225164 RepID=V4B0M6_LOTGI|nr:hypothetical protein LOTGIDRAFT_171148 [Lottia gigantea]ESP03723.1 hypothetical protein LOTGIDRAFT_171148 [Lottia gigantea]
MVGVHGTHGVVDSRILSRVYLFYRFMVHGTHGVVDSRILRKLEEERRVIRGGESYKLNYLLKNECTQKYVQMKFGKRRGRVNARGKPNNLYSQLTFLSEAGGAIRIQGKETKKFLCFSKRGKLVLKLRNQACSHSVARERKIDLN